MGHWMPWCLVLSLTLLFGRSLGEHPNDGKYDDTNACVANAGCCFTIDFSRTSQGVYSNASNTYLQAKATINALNQSPWAEQGVSFSMDPTSTSEPDVGFPYRLWLLNASNPNISGLAYGGLYSEVDELVLVPRTSTDGIASKNFIITATFTKPQLPCISKVRMLRTYKSLQYTTVSMETYSNMESTSLLERRVSMWSNRITQNWVESTFTAPNIARIMFIIWGAGYGAVSELQLCYPPPIAYDKCGVCYGTNSCEHKPAIGDPCSTGMKGACSSGKLVQANNGTNGALMCISIYADTPEVCNGIDDNCDGSIDEDMPFIQCGVGQCFRRIPVCVNGTVQTCTPLPASIEVCDGLDNDCDGLVDEDGVCDPSPPPLSTGTPAPSSTGVVISTNTPAPNPNDSASPSLPPQSLPPTTVPNVWNAGVVPHPVCYTPYTASICSGTFSYEVRSGETGGRNVSIPIGTNNLVQPASYMSPAAGVISSIPTFFIVNPPGGETQTRFQVYFACSVPITWGLGDGHGRLYLAVIDPQYVPLCDSSRADAPVTPYSEGCSKNNAGTECILSAGYFNPNGYTVSIPAGFPTNYFALKYISGASVNLQAQANQVSTFLGSERVFGAFTLQVSCQGVEKVAWILNNTASFASTAVTVKKAVWDFALFPCSSSNAASTK